MVSIFTSNKSPLTVKSRIVLFWYHQQPRTRIQISSEYASLGMLGTVNKVAGQEGVSALWKGVNAAWLREASYTSLRLGLYEPIKVLFGANDPTTATFLGKFLAGSAAGAIGSIAGNPFDGMCIHYWMPIALLFTSSMLHTQISTSHFSKSLVLIHNNYTPSSQNENDGSGW